MNGEETIKIDSDIPIPQQNKWNAPKYPLHDMKVGDSFFVEGLDHLIRGRMEAASRSFGEKQNPKRKFTVRKSATGYRIWRVK